MLLRCESLEPPMSQLGQPLPSRDFCGTAALPLKPDIARHGWHGRKVPILLKKSLMISGSSDSVAVMRFAVEAGDDGAARSRSRAAVLFILS